MLIRAKNSVSVVVVLLFRLGGGCDRRGYLFYRLLGETNHHM